MARPPEGHWLGQLRPLFEGRKVVLATGVAGGCHSRLGHLRSLGAQRPLLLAEGPGTGPIPPPEELEWLALLDADGPSANANANAMARIRSYEEALRSPGPSALAALERYDPRREALVVASQALEAERIGGRPRLGAPRPQWRAFEDKTAIDAFWDRAGVPRLPSLLLDAAGDEEAFREAFRALDRGAGIVLAGDCREGWNGGGEYVRWCESRDALPEALEFCRTACWSVRAAPFVEGVPCSVHGIVFPGGEAAVFGPMEMIVLRRPRQPRLLHSGMATYWEPAPDDREAMRSAARLAAGALHREAGYLGGFTVDGIMGAEGFRPTELNARAGAGLRVVAMSLPALPLELVEVAARAGAPLDFRPAQLEALALEAVGREPRGGGWAAVEGRPFAEAQRRDLWREADGSFRLAAPGELPDAQVLTGPGPAGGGFASWMPNPARTPKGEPLAPRVVRAWEFLDAKAGTGFGPLEAARDVRREALGLALGRGYSAGEGAGAGEEAGEGPGAPGPAQ